MHDHTLYSQMRRRLHKSEAAVLMVQGLEKVGMCSQGEWENLLTVDAKAHVVLVENALEQSQWRKTYIMY